MHVFAPAAGGGGGREKRMNEPCRPTDRQTERQKDREREAASSREMKIGESQINMSIFAAAAAAAAAGAAVFALNSFADVDIVLR